MTSPITSDDQREHTTVEPSPGRRRLGQRLRRAAFFGATGGLLIWAFLAVPLPFLVLGPDPAQPIYPPRESVPVITVDGATDPEVSGALMLTTVTVGQATPWTTLHAAVDRFEEVQPQRAIIPEGVDPAEFFAIQREVFDESVQVAAAVGLRAAGAEVTVRGDGARIVDVIPGAPAEGRLRSGDVVVQAGGNPVGLASELAARTTAAEPGEVLDLIVRRDGQRVPVSVTVGAIPDSDQVGLGVLVETVDQRIELPPGVTVDNVGPIGGPSAGLMLSLTVYELFDPGDLTRGRRIAGTGTIDFQGRVGPIGGVEEKVRGAELAEADLFLAPADQAEAARAVAPDGLEVIGVASIDEAIAALTG